METPFELDPQRYQPPADYVYARDPKLRFDQRRLARVVGVVAFGLPVVLGLGGWALGEFRATLSGYYYEEFVLGDLFVGSLVFIGSLLFAYRGWTPNVAQLATIAGLAALLVAFVPMDGWVIDGTERLYPRIGYWVHAGAAGVLFGVLAFFCFFVFTKVPHEQGRAEMSPAKKMRNRIYRTSGVVIVIAVLSIAIGDQLFGEFWRARNLTFWMEALALGAFGVSWLTQGRAIPGPLRDPRDYADAAEARRRSKASANIDP